MTPGLPVVWERRDRPLEVAAVLAQGDVVRHLAAAAARRIETGAELRVSAATGTILVLGAAADLPWVDGVIYLGREDGCLLPTVQTCRPRAALVAAAIQGDRADGRIVVLVPGMALLAASPRQHAVAQQVAALR